MPEQSRFQNTLPVPDSGALAFYDLEQRDERNERKLGHCARQFFTLFSYDKIFGIYIYLQYIVLQMCTVAVVGRDTANNSVSMINMHETISARADFHSCCFFYRICKAGPHVQNEPILIK